MLIGSHVSISGGVLGAVKEALSYNATTFMMYTGAPQNTRRIPVSKMLVKEGLKLMEENNIDIKNVVIHAPYIINLASYKENTFELALDVLKNEISRTKEIGVQYLVLHPGAYTDKDAKYGINRIAEGLNQILSNDDNVQIALETMSGKGTELGRSFNELAEIIDRVILKDKLCICFDTCHVHDAGYDIINDLDGVLKKFDEVIGLDKLKVFHINGSLNVRGAKKDRHANLGAGADNPKGIDRIGFDTLYKVVHHPLNKGKIFILETPWVSDKENLYEKEIKMLRGKL